MREVLYLCLNSEPRNVGFVFPEELEDDFYSPGFFIIQADHRFFDSEYMFLARVGGNVVSYPLKYIGRNYFNCITEKYGDIKFKAIYAPYLLNRYVGNKSNVKDGLRGRFYILKCEISDQLEYLCKEFDFYFIGSTTFNRDNFG